VALSPDGSQLAAGGFDRNVRIWDTKTGTASNPLLDGKSLVYALAWSHDGKLLATGTMDGTIQLFAITGKMARRRAKLFHRCEIIFALAFSPDDTRLIAGTGDQCRDKTSEKERHLVEVWDVEQQRLERELEGHTSFVYSVAVSSRGVIASAGNGPVRLWDLRTGEAIALLEDAGATNSVSFSSNGRFLLSASGSGLLHGRPGEDNAVRLYSLAQLLGAPRAAGSHARIQPAP
jgi:WD40 repeat protein